MAQGEFTKEEARQTTEAVDEIMKSMSQKKLGEFIGHFNDIFLFVAAAEKAAPTEAEVKSAKQAEGAPI